MGKAAKTVADVIVAYRDTLTRAEKKLAAMLMENYPVSGLGSITTVADNAGVSTPTVARMVQKLGFKGFPDFQARLHQELEATLSNPIAKHDRWVANAPGAHVLNRFADALNTNLRDTLAGLDTQDFDRASDLIANTDRRLYLLGGRITQALAAYTFTHLQVVRPDVTLIGSGSSAWQHSVLDMKAGDVLMLFDIRRYERDMERLASLARARGVQVILLTDEWASPAAKSASIVFRVQIEAPSAWDSSVVTLFLLEALIEAAQSRMWAGTRERMKTLENLFDDTRLFHKPLQNNKN